MQELKSINVYEKLELPNDYKKITDYGFPYRVNYRNENLLTFFDLKVKFLRELLKNKNGNIEFIFDDNFMNAVHFEFEQYIKYNFPQKIKDDELIDTYVIKIYEYWNKHNENIKQNKNYEMEIPVNHCNITLLYDNNLNKKYILKYSNSSIHYVFSPNITFEKCVEIMSKKHSFPNDKKFSIVDNDLLIINDRTLSDLFRDNQIINFINYGDLR